MVCLVGSVYGDRHAPFRPKTSKCPPLATIVPSPHFLLCAALHEQGLHSRLRLRLPQSADLLEIRTQRPLQALRKALVAAEIQQPLRILQEDVAGLGGKLFKPENV